jgi:hypothetical protein
MLYKHHQFVPDGKRNIVVLLHVEGAGKGVDGYGDRRVYGNAFQGAIELPQGIGIAKEKGKYAVFVVGVYAHG